MKTKAECLEQIDSFEPRSIDGREFVRLARFCEEDELAVLGIELAENAECPPPLKLTRDKIFNELREDLAFAFEKALDQRGVSAHAMYCVIKLWLWILEDELYVFEDYAQYGLPLFKAVALKYGLDNPIGSDTGTERKYASD